MIGQIFFTAMMILIQGISALSIVNVPTGTIWNPCSTYGIILEGNGIGPGSNVRVELWDNQDGLDVETAVLADSVLVDQYNTVFVTISCDYPKSRNAFLRVYYRDYNGVSGRIYIRKPEISTKTCAKPTITSTPVHTPTMTPIPSHICTPTMTPTILPTHNCSTSILPTAGAVIHAAPGAVIYGSNQPAPGAVIYDNNQPAPGAVIYGNNQPAAGAVIYVSSTSAAASTMTVVPTSTYTISLSTSTASTSTSSATTAKFSFGSIALALAIALGSFLL